MRGVGEMAEPTVSESLLVVLVAVVHSVSVAAALSQHLTTKASRTTAGGMKLGEKLHARAQSPISGIYLFTLPLVMASLAAVHLSMSVPGFVSVHCGDEGLRLASASAPLWFGASVVLTNLLVYLTYASLLHEGARDSTALGDGDVTKSATATASAVVRLKHESGCLPSCACGRVCGVGAAEAHPSVRHVGNDHDASHSEAPGTPTTMDTPVNRRGRLPFSDVRPAASTATATSARKKRNLPATRRNASSVPVERIADISNRQLGQSRPSVGNSDVRTVPRRRGLTRAPSSRWQESDQLQDLARLSQIDSGGSRRASVDVTAVADKPSEHVEVLHVDDDPVQHLILAKWLKRYTDTTVTSVRSGEEALELLADRAALPGSVQNFPTLIVLDQMMPGIPGTKTARQIRDLYPQAWLPIIITSSLDSDEIRSTGDYLFSGVNDVITKPINKLSLVTTMACQLSNINLQRKNFLLKSILPDSIINRLTAGQKIIADKHESVSILFSDIVGYTSLSARTETPDLIQILNSMFTAFDRLTDRHGVHKVETIGDAYMAAAGHSEESAEDHSQRLVNMAQDMLKATEGIKLSDGTSLRIRVGIHTGPAYAGVVGEKCPRYCFFGDTVNTASRMESTSFPQCIQVSQSTFGHLSASRGDGSSSSSSGSAVGFCPLGSRDIKGKGEMETFLVEAGDWVGVTRPHTYAGDETGNLLLAPLTPPRSKASSIDG